MWARAFRSCGEDQASVVAPVIQEIDLAGSSRRMQHEQKVRVIIRCYFFARYNPAMPNVYGVHETSRNPARCMRCSISPGSGKRSTDAGK